MLPTISSGARLTGFGIDKGNSYGWLLLSPWCKSCHGQELVPLLRAHQISGNVHRPPPSPLPYSLLPRLLRSTPQHTSLCPLRLSFADRPCQSFIVAIISNAPSILHLTASPSATRFRRTRIDGWGELLSLLSFFLSLFFCFCSCRLCFYCPNRQMVS